MSEERSSEIEAKLLLITRDFLSELGKERAKNLLSLSASLQKDLNIDSLGRVELFHRIEEAFHVRLPESLMIQAETLQELVTPIGNAAMVHAPQLKEQQIYVTQEQTHYDPANATSLVEILINRAKIEPNRTHIYLQDDQGDEKIITYGDLLKGAQKIAGGLQSWGIVKGETVALMLPTSEDFFYVFFGILLIGAIPVPIYPPFRPDRIEEYAMRAANILKNAEARLLIIFQRAERLSELLKVFISSLKGVVTVDQLRDDHIPKGVMIESASSALIQYTSGSTSSPKGVLLTHGNLLANIRAVGKTLQMTSADVGVSWLPLYHDMGLIGAWLASFYHANPVVIFSPLSFVSRPERWLWAIHYHQGTLSAAPNFAYELCVRRIQEADIQGLDLKSWRLTLNGAEPINPKTLDSFIKKFEPFGFKRESMLPVYGLAESSVGLTIPPLNRGPKLDKIDRNIFDTEQRAVPVENGDNTLLMVCCGQPLPGHEIRIVDQAENEVPDRTVGNLYFRGPSSMQGYYQQPEITAATYHAGWWDSGDLAYVADGEVYIAGRKKDLIIKAGRNLYPSEIEEITGHVSGVRKGCAIAFGTIDPQWGTEKIVIVAETRETEKAQRAKIAQDITEKVSVVLGVIPDEVIVVPPNTVPKTSSGKLQRAACKKAYLDQKLTVAHRPVFLQILSLYFKGQCVRMRRGIGFTLRLLYNMYIGFLTLLSIPILLLVTLALPSKAVALFIHSWARTMLALIGIPVAVIGAENREKGPLIYIANHASYIDAIVLLAILPAGVRFVGKKELLKVPLLKQILQKLRCITVDRMDFASSISDSKEIENALQEGDSVALFPEGLFTYANGLRPFKLGAFKIAAESNVPLQPLAIAGTREILRGDEFFFKRGKITTTIGSKITPHSKEWTEVMRLHNEAREFIAQHCGEPSIEY
jgi:1-acyl-sn-glycerol-3-phosphate acyltransferase